MKLQPPIHTIDHAQSGSVTNDDAAQEGGRFPRTLGWASLSALAMGGSNQSLFLIAALLVGGEHIPGIGTLGLALFVVGILLSYAALPGWTELVLMYPRKVGGIAAVCTDAFRRYGDMPSALVGICYWWGWIPTCGITAILCASAIHQWFLPQLSVTLMACTLVGFCTLLNLSGIKHVARLSIPIAILSGLLAFISALLPVTTGAVDWHQSFDLRLETPFPGWFGTVTALMAGLYLVGFAAPAFEAVACHVGETKDPARNVPRAIKVSAGMASIFFVALPFIWLGTIGKAELAGNLGSSLSPTFAPLFGSFAKSAALGFMVFNMFHGTMQPLAGASRTLWQMADDGLLPTFLGRLSAKQVPTAATLMTAATAIAFLLFGDPIWLVAAANFTYLIGIAAPSLAVWLLRRSAPQAPRLYQAPRFTLGLGLLVAAIWIASTVLGFQQFGVPTILAGLSMAYSGALLHAFRKWQDRRRNGLHGFTMNLHVKLTGAMLLVLGLDGAGYLLAVSQLPVPAPMSSALADIFTAVALLTMVVGIVLPGTISQTAKSVGDAAERLASVTLYELASAIRTLGEGDTGMVKINASQDQLPVYSRDELGLMSESFNTIHRHVLIAVEGIDMARGQLDKTRSGLIESNRLLEAKVLEERKLIEELRLAKQIVEMSNGAKDRFVARMSHELRTPLHGVLASAELLELRGLDHDATQLAHTIQECGGALLNLVDHMIEVTTTESNEATLNATTFDALAMLNALCRQYQRKAKWKGLSFTAETTGFERYLISVDREKIYWIVNNLLSNAVRFTNIGYVVFKAELLTLANDVNQLSLTVRDSGSGIDLARAEEVFASFLRAEQGSARIVDSAGIGLFLVRELVKKLDGETTMRSEMDAGTDISLTLPVGILPRKDSKPGVEHGQREGLDAYNAGEAVDALEPAEPALWHRPRILLAEDNPVNQAVAMASLKRIGLTADLAVNGRAALARFELAEYDMVLMDCHMPYVDGAAATEAIRALEKARGTSPVPVIGITADMTAGNISRCRRAGMNHILSKPFTVREFEACIVEFLPEPYPGARSAVGLSSNPFFTNARPDTIALPAARSGSEAAHPGDLIFDEQSVRALQALADDDTPDFADDLVKTFVHNATAQLDALMAALADNDSDQIKQISHSLKSSSAYVGASGFSTLMRALERDAANISQKDLMDYRGRLPIAFQFVKESLNRIFAQRGHDV
ncbi:amino acid permease [Robbsia andropogonis]|uniref:amino acid permease n=1 Tax=Robbsia andropogonis TaxID=28092 RepID=UPI0004637CEC|nr:amino acid permease [Robbsia andropogonis]MCP1120692.1 amino acid permease [Robbsia andropogonis]MCP1130426.1 amino acid permease [Robbsia andropogonis]